MSSLFRSLAVAAALLLFAAAPVAAIPAGYDLQISVLNTTAGTSAGSTNIGALSGQITETVDTGLGTTTLELAGPVTWPGGAWTIDSWDSTIKQDPFITNNFVVTNNTAGVLTFTIAVSSPIPSFNASQIIQSTIQMSILDNPNIGGAAASSSPGIDVYQGIVNGSTELSLLTDPFALSCTSPFDCTLNGNTAAGVASMPFGPVLATSIGLTVTFQLSAGDSASVLSRFEIVPEPGTGLLMGLGLAVLASARRRR